MVYGDESKPHSLLWCHILLSVHTYPIHLHKGPHLHLDLVLPDPQCACSISVSFTLFPMAFPGPHGARPSRAGTTRISHSDLLYTCSSYDQLWCLLWHSVLHDYLTNSYSHFSIPLNSISSRVWILIFFFLVSILPIKAPSAKHNIIHITNSQVFFRKCILKQCYSWVYYKEGF